METIKLASAAVLVCSPLFVLAGLLFGFGCYVAVIATAVIVSITAVSITRAHNSKES